MRLSHLELSGVLPCILLLVLVSWAVPVIAQTTDDDEPNGTFAAEAEPNAEEAPLLAGTQYRHVAGSAFVPLYADSGVTYGSKGCTYMTADIHLFLNYSLDLPHGSTVTTLRVYFNDTSPADGTLYLAQYDDGASYVYLASVATSGSSGFGSATTSGLTIQLDNVNYNYVLYWVPGISGVAVQLCGFRVDYTEPLDAALAADEPE